MQCNHVVDQDICLIKNVPDSRLWRVYAILTLKIDCLLAMKFFGAASHEEG